MVIYSASNSSDKTHEDKEALRLLRSGRKPHPKKRHRTERAAPRPDQRRRRVEEKDSDLSKVGIHGRVTDSDLSLSNRLSNNRFSVKEFIKPNLPEADDQDSQDKPELTSKSIQKKNQAVLSELRSKRGLFIYFDSVSKYGKLYSKIEEASSEVSVLFQKDVDKEQSFKDLILGVESALGSPLMLESSRSNISPSWPGEKVTYFKYINNAFNNFIDRCENLYKIGEQLKVIQKGARSTLSTVQDSWEASGSDNTKWAKRAGILASLQRNIKKGFPKIPDSMKNKSALDPKSLLNDLLSVFDDDSSEAEVIDLDGIDKSDMAIFNALSTIYKELASNPENPNWESIRKNIINRSEKIKTESDKLRELRRYKDAWEDGIESLYADDTKIRADVQSGDYDRYIKLMDEMARRPKTVFDWKAAKQKLLDSNKALLKTLQKHGVPEDEIPPQLLKAAFKIPMKSSLMNMKREAAYHGVLIQGHPNGPTNTGWNSIDSRYLTDVHFNSIIASAKKMLKDNQWFVRCWDGGSSDAPVRAALDLSIATTDGSIYQNKIDAPTYEKLLNKLANWEYDTFEDTVLNMHSNPKKRKANIESEDYSFWLDYL